MLPCEKWALPPKIMSTLKAITSCKCYNRYRAVFSLGKVGYKLVVTMYGLLDGYGMPSYRQKTLSFTLQAVVVYATRLTLLQPLC